MGISPLGKDSGQKRLQSTSQSKLFGPTKGEQHDQHAAGRNQSCGHLDLLWNEAGKTKKAPPSEHLVMRWPEDGAVNSNFRGWES